MNQQKKTLEEEFNSFIKKWCGDSYPHLIDSDQNDGERFRELLREQISEESLKNIINKLKYECDVGYCIDLEDLEKELMNK